MNDRERLIVGICPLCSKGPYPLRQSRAVKSRSPLTLVFAHMTSAHGLASRDVRARYGLPSLTEQKALLLTRTWASRGADERAYRLRGLRSCDDNHDAHVASGKRSAALRDRDTQIRQAASMNGPGSAGRTRRIWAGRSPEERRRITAPARAASPFGPGRIAVSSILTPEQRSEIARKGNAAQLVIRRHRAARRAAIAVLDTLDQTSRERDLSIDERAERRRALRVLEPAEIPA